MLRYCTFICCLCCSGDSMKLPAIRYSPAAQIPADHTNSSEVMQKKLIDCPISSHDPVT